MQPNRLFIAAYPPLDVAQSLLEAARPSLPANAKLVTAEQVHLTLFFIGSVRRIEMDELVESVDRAASGRGPAQLTLNRLCVLPETGEPRILAALGYADGNLLEIQKRLAARLARFRPKADRDRFLPHLTLARFAPASPRVPGMSIEPISWNIRELRLMDSRLRPSGAVHALVHASRLGS
ncbi:MAG: RNA 2',3'-cyclic phosphodiesterase [Phycisphaerales bacterium]|nr:RNA 2',3'-cyclic phosphodiesterase [Phycisphaerales bacterium]